ncbi:MAG: metallophosphoesterase [Campylobacterota bacterium]
MKNCNKTYIIGDVHGCFYTVKSLLKKLPNHARIVFVGDICDRGLYSKRIFDLILEYEYECVLGNHERYMIEYTMDILKGGTNRWLKDSMGGKETLASYKGDTKAIIKHMEYIKTLPRYMMIENYFITHGFGLPYFKRKDRPQSLDGLTKNRISDQKEWGHDWESGYEEYDVINIFGHTPYAEVKRGKNYFGIDTGCVYGRKLTAIELGSHKIVQQPLDKRDTKN